MTTKTVETVTDTRPINLPEGLPFIKGDTNKKLVRAAWRESGVNPEYPIETRGAFALLRIIGYDANRQRLDYCLQRGYLPAPSKQSGQFAWKESDIIAFADALESLRAWLPLAKPHLHKLTPDELAKHHQEAAARRSAVDAFRAMNPCEIINLLVACDNAETRELLGLVLKEQTELLNVRGNEHVPEHDPRETN